MDFEKLASLLFPDVKMTPNDLEERYPLRQLPENAAVTRMAPSPTGFMHLGNLLAAVTAERLAHQSGGVFFLRIEDTDAKREVEGGTEAIISAFSRYELMFDEGVSMSGETGDYGPYRQRGRADVYHVIAKHMVGRGLAYPCFCTESELEDMRRRQEAEKANYGYYGKWTVWRDADMSGIEAKLSEGAQYVLRLRSNGDPEHKIRHNDLVKGKMELPENDMDIVLLKSDGIPTYHFAHVADDHLMRTTHVVRGDEWLATLPVHLQLFYLLGWKPPKFLHISPLMKLDGKSKRKLSKRLDSELSLDFYAEEGYPVDAVLEYLFTILNSNFEEFRLKNPEAPIGGFKFTSAKMSASGALFDLAKLRDVSQNVISRMTAERALELASDWAGMFDPAFRAILARDPAYSASILNIGRGVPKPRRDITSWKDVKPYVSFFFDELFAPDYIYPPCTEADAGSVLNEYAGTYDQNDDRQTWFDKIKALAERHGYAPDTKLYKSAPEGWKGHVGDVSMVLRVALTGRQNSPDLYDVCKILGPDKVAARLKAAVRSGQ